MQLQSLRLFMAVADTGSFKAAASQRHTVQSNVTAHIKKLEAELGVALFSRQAGVHLTSAGRQLRVHAEATLAAHDNAIAMFSENGTPRGELHIGAMESTAAVRLPSVLTDYHRRYPQVNLCLSTGTTAELVSRLLAGRLDAVFIAGEVPDPRLETVDAFDESLVLVSDRPHRTMPSAEALSATPFLAFRQGCHYRHRIERLFAHHGIHGGRIFEFGSLDAILGCAAAGMGYALLPQAIVDTHRSRFAIHGVALPADIGQVTTRLAAPERASWSPALAAFEQLVKASTPERAA